MRLRRAVAAVRTTYIESRTGIRSFCICSASVGYLMRIFVARSVEVHGLYTKAELGEQREAKDGNGQRVEVPCVFGEHQRRANQRSDPRWHTLRNVVPLERVLASAIRAVVSRLRQNKLNGLSSSAISFTLVQTVYHEVSSDVKFFNGHRHRHTIFIDFEIRTGCHSLI